MNPKRCRPRGITLLEVLVSMGLLAVGLLATLALFPAGGTYLRNADIDDRAAALIPSAFATMRSQGLFGADSLYWSDPSANPANDGEAAPPGWERIEWDITKEIIPSGGHYASFDDPPTISGVAPAGAVVNITATTTNTNPTVVKTFTTSADVATGDFSLTLDRSDLSIPGKELMTIYETPDTSKMGDPKDYYEEWEFTASCGEPPHATTIAGLDIAVPSSPPRMSNEPQKPKFRQYRKRRKVGQQLGPAKFERLLSGIESTSTDSADAKILGNFPPRGQVYANGRVVFFRESALNVTGELWRVQTGRQKGTYAKLYDFTNTNPPQTRTAKNEDDESGTSRDDSKWFNENWVEKDPNCPEGVKEDTADWFKFLVKKGELVTVTPEDATQSLKNLSFDVAVSRSQRLLPLYFNGDNDAHLLEPVGSSGNSLTYEMPSDGTVYTRMNLMKVGTGGPKDDGIDADHQIISPNPLTDIHRINATPKYAFDVSIVGNTRAAVIDPLMVSHIDRIISLRWPDGLKDVDPEPLRDQQKYFATFQQSGRSERTNIPRMTWKYLAASPSGGLRTFAQSLALAERLCRPYDTLDVVVPTDEALAPKPIFESSADSGGLPTPTMRRSVGRMSWLLTIQPENNGSIELNWRSGNFFDVAIVVYENRLIPPPDAIALEGEYVFDGEDGAQVGWNPATGLIDISIATSRDIALDDMKRIFRPGAWLMVVTKAFNHNQTIDWIEVQSCEFDGQVDGSTIAHVLPAREPRTGQTDDPDDFEPLVVIAHQGVVAVARRSVRIE